MCRRYLPQRCSELCNGLIPSGTVLDGNLSHINIWPHASQDFLSDKLQATEYPS